jgi:hypothetical protein
MLLLDLSSLVFLRRYRITRIRQAGILAEVERRGCAVGPVKYTSM